MAKVSVTIARNVHAVDEHNMPVLVALATVIHENGQTQTVAVREDQARFHSGSDDGKSFILSEIERAAQSPTAPQLGFVGGNKQ